MIERPEITRWKFTRESDGVLYTKKRVINAILSEVKKTGSFDAARVNFGLGITGIEGAEEYDKSHITLRNKILQLRLEGDKIVVTTANYNEYYISENEMESWFEILKEAREHAKTARAEARLAQTLTKEVEKRRDAEQKIPSPKTGTSLDDSYVVPNQFQQVFWAT